MTRINPNYYAILTANVRYDNRLTDSEKLLYAEITALTEKTGECWATNKYFAELYDVTTVTISRRISKLKDCGYIEVEIIYKNNTKEIDKRVIKIPETYYQNCYGGINRIVNRGINRIVKENTTSMNTTSNNDILSVYEYWNSKGIIVHRELTRTIEGAINTKLNKYSLEEILKAIDNYDYILKSDNHFLKYKWKLNEFLQRSFERFVDYKIADSSYRKDKKGNKSFTQILNEMTRGENQ